MYQDGITLLDCYNLVLNKVPVHTVHSKQLANYTCKCFIKYTPLLGTYPAHVSFKNSIICLHESALSGLVFPSRGSIL